ncbi:TetR/AcrR family transcriptional regulator [Streptomyces sp. NPDC088196]|uniref:TetR/AcrR family transcriptional regulator n=1 Tax=Streptomyces sp. NPDC088196 TaxID=3154868 RepID=UPI00344C2344
MTAPRFGRARSAEGKPARETASLEAAARLADRRCRATSRSGRRSFCGWRLAADEWTQWTRDTRTRLGELGRGLGDGSPAGPETQPKMHPEKQAEMHPETQIAAVAGILADALVARPLFCDLLAHTPLNLERGVSFAAVRSFKLIAIAEAGAVGALWQMAAPGTELRRFYQDTPELAHALIDVEPRLADILAALLTGYRRRP